MYAYCYAVIKRLEGAGHVIAANTIRIPNIIMVVWSLIARGIKY